MPAGSQQRTEPVRTGLACEREHLFASSACSAGVTLAVTEMQPMPSIGRLASAVASSPLHCIKAATPGAQPGWPRQIRPRVLQADNQLRLM